MNGCPEPVLHLALDDAVLCIECDRIFKVGPAVCPACGSGAFTSLARWLTEPQGEGR